MRLAQKFEVVLVLGIFVFVDAIAQTQEGSVVFTDQGIAINVEIAQSAAQRQQGLMHRQLLPSNNGMLFVFEQVGWQRVWMKNTLISLDVVFISEQGKIVSMLENLQPCFKMHCKIYHSTVPAKYMLEMNAGKIRQLKIKTGQSLVIDIDTK